MPAGVLGARAHPLGCSAQPEMAQGGPATHVCGVQRRISGNGGETAASGHGEEHGRRGTTRERRCVYWLGEGKLEEARVVAAVSLAGGLGRCGRVQHVQAPESEGE